MSEFKESICLNGSITPQSFGLDGEKFYIFDRMNNYEGRFCRIDGNSIIPIFEILSGQGIVFENGDFFLIDIGETTFISRLDQNGKKVEEISLNGTYFDFRVDESGNYICLGNMNNATIIKIKNRIGSDLKTICPNGIAFGSAIYIEGDYLYLGGFDSSNRLVTIKMNYAGLIDEKWVVESGFSEGIVSKIVKHKEMFYILVSGKDSIIAYDIENKMSKKIKPAAIGLEEIVDFNLYEENIYVMDRKRIINFAVEEIKCIKSKKRETKHNGSADLICCAYMMYSTGSIMNILESILPSFLLSTIIILLVNDVYVKNEIRYLFPLWIYALPFLSYIFVSIKNTLSILDKTKRVEFLLKLCGSTPDNTYMAIPFYNFAFIVSFFSILLYPNDGSYITIVASTLFLLVDFCFLWFSKRRLESLKDNIVVELLDECDGKIRRYINEVTNIIRENRTEKLSISITTGKKIGQKKINKWLESRKFVVGDGVSISINEKEVSTCIDLSTRNIKYSRYGIIMDYISFIAKLSDIRDIRVTIMDVKRS